MRPTFALFTLGCKANQYDSHVIAEQLRLRGWQQVDFDENADAYIVDTCTVTRVADHKSRKVVRRATRRDTHPIVAVTGCAAEWSSHAFQQMDGVDLVVPNCSKANIPDLVHSLYTKSLHASEPKEEQLNVSRASSFPPRASRGSEKEDQSVPLSAEENVSVYSPPHVRLPLKIQDGCNRRCSFCIVPKVRGRSRSRPVADVVNEARKAVANGFREIVLTGIQMGDYGHDLPEGKNAFLYLIEQLHDIEGLRRLRLSSLLPQDVSDDLVTLMVNAPRMCRHMHIPLQSGCDTILKAMRRGYTIAEYEERITRIREAIPDIGLTTDLMVGFPGESDRDFSETLKATERIGFSDTHIFKYSRRPGTRAGSLPDQVSERIKEDRSRQLFQLSAELSARYAARHCGVPTEVLVEKVEVACSKALGYTDTYVRTFVYGEGLMAGECVMVVPQAWEKDHLTATLPGLRQTNCKGITR